MSLFAFSKYSGCGNDFVIFDDRKHQFPIEQAASLIPHLCQRRLGVGADGVILLQGGPPTNYRMRVFNSDGSEAEMCGNGVRCLAHFMQQRKLASSQFEMLTAEGSVKIEYTKDGICSHLGPLSQMQWQIRLDTPQGFFIMDLLNTGVPHLVHQVVDVEAVDLLPWARPLRHHNSLSQGANVNIYHIEGPQQIRYRTYERGVEEETLACGTGAAAVAISAARQHSLQSPLSLCTSSGEILTITFKITSEGAENISITGPATQVFEGLIDLNQQRS